MAMTSDEVNASQSTPDPDRNAIAPETLEFFKGDALRARVFHDKYALRDPDGRVLERTPVAMWQRIARGLASVEPTEAGRERYAQEFYWLMDGFRFIPGGRIMHAIGNPKRVTALNCFPAGTRVLARGGLKPIEEIRPGDEVLTHKNRYRLVTHTMHRDVEDPLRALKLWYLGDQPIRATGNHPFLAFDGTRVDWVAAQDLTSDHYIKVGRIGETLPSWDLDLTNFVSAAAIEDEAGQMYTATAYVGGQGARGVAESKRVRRTIPLDERLGLWLGFFMAEGGVTDNSVYFTFSKDEEAQAEAIYNLTQQLFGVEAAIQRREDQPGHWMRVYVHSRLLVEFVRAFCGGATHAHDKRLPGWFLTVPTTVQKAFIAALLAGDGVVREEQVKIFLANPDLVRQVFLILVRLGIVPSIRWEAILKYTRHRGMWIQVSTQRYVEALHAWIEGDYSYESVFEESDGNHFYKVVDGELFVKVKACGWTEPARQTVYDLTVDEDHSFVTEFACCHNCYVIPIKEDSIEAIFEWTKEAARTYSLGGGVGADISILRPAGAPVNNAARTSTGSTSFMELMSLTTGTIGQSGRRGALMITIADNHPDVLEFTKIKRNMNKVRYANISVRISDAFMRAVEADADWTLAFDNNRVNVRQTVKAREVWRELIYGARNHAEPGVIFWDSIRRWSTSEYNEMNVTTTNPCSLVGSTYVMTPSGIHRLDQLVTSAVQDRRNPEVLIDRRAGDERGVSAVHADALAFTGVKRIYRVETASGLTVRGTGDHKVKVLNDDRVDPLHGSNGWKRIDELQAGDVLAIVDPNAPALVETMFRDRTPYLHVDRGWMQPRRRDAHCSLIDIPDAWDDDLAYLLGYAVGDGSYTNHANRGHGKRLDIHMHVDDAPYVKPVVDRVTGRCVQRKVPTAVGGGVAAGTLSAESRPDPLHTIDGTNRAWMSIHSGAFLRMLGALGLRPAVAPDRLVPESILTAPKDATAAFLRGLFDADGTVSQPGARPMISLSSTSRQLIQQVQILLLQFGIFSTVATHRAEDKNASRSGLNYITNGGERRIYHSVHDSYQLAIGRYPSIEKFATHIGSSLPRKQTMIQALCASRVHALRSVTSTTEVTAVIDEGVDEPVYDLTVLDTKSFIANGLVVSNSEIPLEPYGCCCLGNVNLAEFVTDEFSPQAQVDWPHLEQALRLATRFLDNVLDYNADKHPLPAQREASLYSRRIGVGFTGLGDLLCKLRLKYDTDEAVAEVDRLFERIKNVVYDESVNLAIEKGPFPGYDREQHLKGAFLETLDPKVLARIREHGLRNVALLTVPPVGSGASLAGTTSGIEPIFDLSYTRRSESLAQSTFTVYHPLVRSYMERFGLTDEDGLPPFFVTAHEIKPEMRVQMQAAIQKHIDHSISSTVNCPADTSEERVAEIYFKAWKMGCKGITVYRDSSRENILTASTARSVKAAGGEGTKAEAAPVPVAAPATEVVHHKRPRPKVTTGRTERIETPRGRIYVTINEDTKGLCEVFVQSLDVEADAIGRLASLALRTGADARDVIEQLWRVQSREVAIDRSGDGTIVRVTTIAQGVALAIGRALYGSGFRPDQAFPMADRLPEPRIGNGHANGGNGHATAGAADPPQAEVALQGDPALPPEVQQPLLTFAGVCPDCGSSLVFENGCSHCRSCGYSKC
ncbi:MAG TPA: LAGLIDADG family homing endonuclease [bacterium]|nr:LAGLIDADG family homing endonuclease [bacterium]